uniref:Ig-like domain-containing protein n=1 Tax=Pundamilia nyererei TaxID=303518 RepID=A0A3B4GD03_9CICH
MNLDKKHLFTLTHNLTVPLLSVDLYVIKKSFVNCTYNKIRNVKPFIFPFALTVTSVWGRQHCRGKGYCVTLSERELTAEAGLCVVIPCSFTTAANFTPKHIVWYKCEASKKCSDADITFHSNKKKKKVQSGFEGRVSSLESDASQKNCSIIINDLKVSDSGSYQLKVTGEWNGKKNINHVEKQYSVMYNNIFSLKQKPTVMIPTLTEGQQATLTCTAPGLCSGSAPQITWTWRGAGGTESYITGNSTDFKTENLTDVTQRHVSTLTFNPSAEQHNTNVTCKIHFTGETTTEKTAGLNVNCDYFLISYLKQNIAISSTDKRIPQIIGNTTIKEGDVLNLTCSVESFPPSLIMWSKLSSKANHHNDTGSATLVIPNATAEHSGQYICTAKYMDSVLKKDTNVTVICKYTTSCNIAQKKYSWHSFLHRTTVHCQHCALCSQICRHF